MMMLDAMTWVRFAVWMIVGKFIQETDEYEFLNVLNVSNYFTCFIAQAWVYISRMACGIVIFDK